MKLPRYRRPSLNTLLGITKAKKRVKKELGITAVLNWGGFDEVGRAVQAEDQLTAMAAAVDADVVAHLPLDY